MDLPEYESKDAKREHAGEQNAFVATVLHWLRADKPKSVRLRAVSSGDEALRFVNLPQFTALNLNKCVRLMYEGMAPALTSKGSAGSALKNFLCMKPS